MKKTVKVKNLIAFAAVLILLFSITVIPAYAEFPPLTPLGRRVGSWILAGLTALNITLTSTVAESQGADIMNFLGDPFDNIYSYTEFWEDKPTIQIWDDYVTIDGVTYTDIWLSNEAAQKFKTDGLDFATAYSIASNTNGTFADGVGYIDGNPIFYVDGANRSQKIAGEFGTQFSVGDTGALSVGATSVYTNPYERKTYSTGSVLANYPTTWWYTLTNNESTAKFGYQYKANQGWTGYTSTNIDSRLIDTQDFDFDYVAGTIDPTPLGPDDGLMIRVPSDTPGLQNFITNNYYLTEPTEIDVDLDPDIQGTLDDLIDIIAPILINLDSHDITYVENHDGPQPAPAPEPAPDVDPDTPINEITYNDYYQTITNQTEFINNTVQNIDNSLTEINDNVTASNDILENIESNTRWIWDDTTHIDAGVTYISQDIQTMVENQETLIENQDTIINNQETIIDNQDQYIENQDTIINDSIPEIIENIPKIDEICNNIDTAPYHDLDTGLNHLPTIILPFITDLRSALGIWHYVTEWIGQISTTFAFVTGCLVGTSIMTPIYAAIAGFMCIKVYRRMTG